MIPIPSFITTKVLGGALAGSLIISGVLGGLYAWKCSELTSAKEVIQRLEGWQGSMVTTVSLASGSKVTVETAQAQVQALGTSLASTKAELGKQNRAVEQLGEEKRAAEAAAAREAKARAAAIQSAQDLAKQLLDQSQSPVSSDKTDAEVRRTQDQLYEAGL